MREDNSTINDCPLILDLTIFSFQYASPASNAMDNTNARTPPIQNDPNFISAKNVRKNTPIDGQRDRRFIAIIQASLNNGSTLLPPTLQNARNKSPNNNEKEFTEISQIIGAIKLADDDVCVAVADVKSSLLRKAGSISNVEFSCLCTAFCESALHQTNLYSIIDLCIELIDNEIFQAEMSESLEKFIIQFVSNLGEGEEDSAHTVPEFLAQLLVARWPRKYKKAIESCNQILFTISNTILGWVQCVNESAIEKDEGSKTEANLALRCAQGLVQFCMSGQRSIWLNSPELFDDIYSALKNLLTSDISMSRSLKRSLLQLFLSMNKWSASNVPKYSVAATQTVIKPF